MAKNKGETETLLTDDQLFGGEVKEHTRGLRSRSLPRQFPLLDAPGNWLRGEVQKLMEIPSDEYNTPLRLLQVKLIATGVEGFTAGEVVSVKASAQIWQAIQDYRFPMVMLIGYRGEGKTKKGQRMHEFSIHLPELTVQNRAAGQAAAVPAGV